MPWVGIREDMRTETQARLPTAEGAGGGAEAGPSSQMMRHSDPRPDRVGPAFLDQEGQRWPVALFLACEPEFPQTSLCSGQHRPLRTDL